MLSNSKGVGSLGTTYTKVLGSNPLVSLILKTLVIPQVQALGRARGLPSIVERSSNFSILNEFRFNYKFDLKYCFFDLKYCCILHHIFSMDSVKKPA